MKRILLIVVALLAATELYALDSLAVQAVKPLASPIVVDTLKTENSALSVLLFNDGTWRYVQSATMEQDSTLYNRYWDTENVSAYRTVSIDSIPKSVAINLVDSLKHYRYPYIGRVTSRYGMRHRRAHNGIDIALKVGDTICAAFDGQVRFSKATNTGYGTLVIIRHDNGLETYHGHLSARLVEENDRVVAGQPIALGGNSGRSTGPHLHFETRYYGQSFDPERLINFKTGELRRDHFLLKKSYFSIYSKYEQDFNAEAERDEAEKKENALSAEKRYYKVRSGDYLGLIAKRNHTTVSAICRLNGIKPTTTLQIGRVLRVK
ncbi:MAG: peptidoglycan DD-metalloendopeptidase family protein [Alistipes sp.]|jgi:murein DD-endopeptidase MepM/ murein hydrolase activator NlpD|nr:peptidoglycan DD-metalloendopeptidase family protein [Alistipes sp.]